MIWKRQNKEIYFTIWSMS